MKIKSLFLLLLIIISLIPLLDFFRPGLALTHDGRDHVVRIASFYQSLSEGNLAPRWAGNLNRRYGHPVLMFFYPFSSYLGSLFKFLGFSFVFSTKMVFVIGFILSGVFMYLWIKELWGEKAGFTAGLIYMFAPYRFVDLYVRGAIGECTAFLWPPLICYFLLKLSREAKYGYLAGASLSLAGLILSHNALSLMFLPVILGYAAYLWLGSRQKSLDAMRYSLVAVFGFVLSAFFWVPAFFEAKYTLRDIVMKGFFGGFESVSRLVWSSWNYGGTGQFSVQAGALQWLMILAAPFLIWRFFKQKKKEWLFLSLMFICFWLAIFLILPASGFIYDCIGLLRKFQFAWRFLSLAVLPPAIFAGAVIASLPEKKQTAALMIFLVLALWLNKNFYHSKEFLYRDEAFYTQFTEGTTNDTGESAPRWSIRFMEQFPAGPMEVIEGQAEIEEIKRLTNCHLYQVKAGMPTRIVENTLYFPGWRVLVNNQEVEVEFQDPAYRGLMTFWLDPGEHQVEVVFGETKLRLFADLISLGGLVGLLTLGVILELRKTR